jgi:hypothetical protein
MLRNRKEWMLQCGWILKSAEWKKLYTKGHILYDYILWCYKTGQINLW